MMHAGHALGSAVMTLGIGVAVDAAAQRAGFATPIPPADVVLAAVIGIPFASGPDIDNRGLIKDLFGHRYGVHWFGWPLIFMVGMTAVVLALTARTGAPALPPFWAYGPPLAWLWHIWPADWAFGKRGRDIPKGIPRWPTRHSPRHGLGLRVTAKNTRMRKAVFGRREHSALEWITTATLVPILVWEVIMLQNITVLAGQNIFPTGLVGK